MMHTLILLAQQDPAQQQGPGIIQFLPLIAIAAVFYLLLIRPMKRQEQERQRLASNLKKNDEIVTNSGIYGTITDVSESEDKITVKIADNVRIKMTKGSVLRNLTNEEAASASKDSQKSEGIKLPEQGVKPPDRR
jgi:preprotein translocase subunit YajC